MDILSAVRRFHLFNSGDSVVVAVSGGPDSVAMLHALHCCSAEFGISLHVAHLNHGIRGKEADLDEDFVRSLARELGLACTCERARVPSLKRELRMGEEEAAREIRYKFLHETAAKVGANRIAVGHTADDRAETVLLNILRGTGVEGLAAMRPVAGEVLRPLIDAWRADVMAYLAEHGLSYRVDETNADLSYARNRIRHELIPLLERYNPQIKAALVRLAEVAEMESNLLDELAPQAAGRTLYQDAFDAELFSDLPPAIQARVVRAELERLRGDLKDVTLEQIRRVVGALQEGTDFKITLPSGRIYAIRKGTSFAIRRKAGSHRVEPFEHPLAVPGETLVEETGLRIRAELREKPVPERLPMDEALIDVGTIAGALRVRSIRRGDRIVPFGMKQPKKLQDVFVDKKVPREVRGWAVVVADDEKVLWVPGIVTSECVRITRRTKLAVYLRT